MVFLHFRAVYSFAVVKPVRQLQHRASRLQILLTGTCRLWSTVVRVHRLAELSGHICTDLQDIDIGLSGSSLAKTMCDEEGL